MQELTSGKEKVGMAVAAIPFCVTLAMHQDPRAKISYCSEQTSLSLIT
ncbi:MULTISPECIES: hypothetical protein [unclassified Serratia (in: enterobacteria)]|nr:MULTISPECIES: hypothetical protein [unclassified Serratia (in: enterobacteria)]